MRRPGIEPGSQEWESCMIPLHQRRTLALEWSQHEPARADSTMSLHKQLIQFWRQISLLDRTGEKFGVANNNSPASSVGRA